MKFHKKAYSFILLLRKVFAPASLLTAAPGTAQHCQWRDMWREKKFCCHVNAVVLRAGSEVPTRIWAKDQPNKPPSNHMLASVPIQTVEILFVQSVVSEYLRSIEIGLFLKSAPRLVKII